MSDKTNQEPLVIDGKEINVQPVKVGQLQEFFAEVEPILQVAQNDPDNYLAALLANANAMTEVIVMSTNVERDWLAEQTADVYLALAIRVIEGNTVPLVKGVGNVQAGSENSGSASTNGLLPSSAEGLH